MLGEETGGGCFGPRERSAFPKRLRPAQWGLPCPRHPSKPSGRAAPGRAPYSQAVRWGHRARGMEQLSAHVPVQEGEAVLRLTRGNRREMSPYCKC